MRAHIEDSVTLSEVSPLDVLAYLRSHGWAQTEEWPNGTGWTNGSDALILIPNDRGARDWARRLSEAVQSLSEAEQRSELQVFNDIAEASADILRITIGDPDATAGQLALPRAAGIVDAARDLLVAAACSVIDPRPAYGTHKPHRATNYVNDRVRLGQTERGSFVFTVLSRVTPLLSPGEAGDFFPESLEEPFERRVTLTLSDGIAAVKASNLEAMRSGKTSGFIESVSKGVSANLCDALATIGYGPEASSFQMQMSWSLVRPYQRSSWRTLRFEREEADVMREAARVLRESAPREGFELEGIVVRLQRKGGSGPGEVTITGWVDGAIRPVSVVLNAEMYQRAIQAHRDYVLVHLIGTLAREGRGFTLREPSSFDLVLSE